MGKKPAGSREEDARDGHSAPRRTVLEYVVLAVVAIAVALLIQASSGEIG